MSASGESTRPATGESRRPAAGESSGGSTTPAPASECATMLPVPSPSTETCQAVQVAEEKIREMSAARDIKPSNSPRSPPGIPTLCPALELGDGVVGDD
ncbi:hypothetical protein NHX12_030563 [Muraenolepis orangiensis]|uniref:Uncharacterized protein n=1 Tax=Muraenolepis orangiensis TaxID=630683 RepID=A0A9Q0ILS2_9TELE|nr:hypothetical protein NHX12_016756 [Muraenolepis orangiensis]KAJ3602815.1 hypothetical protein NHX12_030563 [Muraenolepis orangiensis]